jgi:hypothetical protein
VIKLTLIFSTDFTVSPSNVSNRLVGELVDGSCGIEKIEVKLCAGEICDRSTDLNEIGDSRVGVLTGGLGVLGFDGDDNGFFGVDGD